MVPVGAGRLGTVQPGAHHDAQGGWVVKRDLMLISPRPSPNLHDMVPSPSPGRVALLEESV